MSHTNIKLYGTNWCSDCKRSKKFLGEQRVHYDFVNIEEDTEGQDFVQKLQNGGMTIPVHPLLIIFSTTSKQAPLF